MARYAHRRCPACGSVHPSSRLESVPPEPGFGVALRVRCPGCGHAAQMWAFRSVGSPGASESRSGCRGARLDGAPCGQWTRRGREFCWYHGPDAGLRWPNCVVCRDPRRAEIETMLAGGARPSAVAARFCLARNTLWYHRTRHLPPAEGGGGEG
jgi:hypothetical protein